MKEARHRKTNIIWSHVYVESKKKKKVELIVTKSKMERWLGGGQKWGDID